MFCVPTQRQDGCTLHALCTQSTVLQPMWHMNTPNMELHLVCERVCSISDIKFKETLETESKRQCGCTWAELTCWSPPGSLWLSHPLHCSAAPSPRRWSVPEISRDHISDNFYLCSSKGIYQNKLWDTVKLTRDTYIQRTYLWVWRRISFKKNYGQNKISACKLQAFLLL